jgi:hypothetical protein
MAGPRTGTTRMTLAYQVPVGQGSCRVETLQRCGAVRMAVPGDADAQSGRNANKCVRNAPRRSNQLASSDASLILIRIRATTSPVPEGLGPRPMDQLADHRQDKEYGDDQPEPRILLAFRTRRLLSVAGNLLSLQARVCVCMAVR